MRTKCFIIIALLMSNCAIFAQKNSLDYHFDSSAQKITLDEMFDTYEDVDDVVVITISKALFKLFPEKINTGDVDISNILPKVELLRIMTSSSIEMSEAIIADVKNCISKNKDYEELMRIKENKSSVFFYAKKKGDTISELVMYTGDGQSATVIQIVGNFTLEDVQKISKKNEKIDNAGAGL